MTAPAKGRTPASILAELFTYAHGRAAALLVLALALTLQWLAEPQGFQPLRLAVFDFYQQLRPRIPPERIRVAIVEIDEASLEQYGQWPWPRTLMAELVERTASLGPLAIGLDMVMAESDRLSPAGFVTHYPELTPKLRQQLKDLPATDTLFAEAIASLPVVIGRIGIDEKTAALDSPPKQTWYRTTGPDPHRHLTSFTSQQTSLPVIDNAARGWGFLNVNPGPDGVVRRVPLALSLAQEQIVPSLALEVLRVAIGEDLFTVHGHDHGLHTIELGDSAIPTDPDGTIRLHFAQDSHPQRRHAAATVLAGGMAQDALANQIALIGATGTGLGDVVATPVAARMDGIEVQAQVIDNILDNTRLIRPPYAFVLEAAALALGGLVLIALVPKLKPVFSPFPWLALAVLFCAAGFAAFATARLLLDPTFPVAGTGLISLSLSVSLLMILERNRRSLSRDLEQERLTNARMTGELNAARKIQMGLLPDPGTVALPPPLAVHAVLEPAREIGGDLYDLFMADDHRLCFVVGDVSEKGAPAALLMASSHSAFRSTVWRTGDSPGTLVEAVNAEIIRGNPSQMFVTAVAGFVDARNGALAFCNAGHPDPLLMRPGQPVATLESTGGPPLGFMEDWQYPVARAQLLPGDILVIITDGATEAGIDNGPMYGHDRLAALLDELTAAAGPHTVVERVYADVKNYMKGMEPSDDITIIAIQYRGP